MAEYRVHLKNDLIRTFYADRVTRENGMIVFERSVLRPFLSPCETWSAVEYELVLAVSQSDVMLVECLQANAPSPGG